MHGERLRADMTARSRAASSRHIAGTSWHRKKILHDAGTRASGGGHSPRGDSFPAAWRVGHQVTLACRRRGVILRNIGDVVVLMPAPAMPLDLVDRLCHTVQESLQEVLGALPTG